MTDDARRTFLAAGLGLGATGLAALTARRAEADIGAVNKPDPLLDEKTLQTFKFELEKSEGKVIGGSSGKEATVKQLPISKAIAGVSMRLEPGAMRELHWHATAAEWAYVIDGRVRTTAIDPAGYSETNDFEPGDIWYFPRGHGHMLECLGDKTCHFVLVFDNGYFSEFGTFSSTDWLGHVPPRLLAKNLGLPESAFAQKFPKDEVYFARGKKPPQDIPRNHNVAEHTPPNSHKYRMLAQEPHSVHPGGREWRVGQDKFPISKTVTGVILELEPGGLRELHWHPNSNEWQYVIEGDKIEVTMFASHGRFRIETLSKGDVAYIPQGFGHSIENRGDKPLKMIIAFDTNHYEAIDLSFWLANQPGDVLATNFGIPEELVKDLPKKRVFIASKDGPTGAEPSEKLR